MRSRVLFPIIAVLVVAGCQETAETSKAQKNRLEDERTVLAINHTTFSALASSVAAARIDLKYRAAGAVVGILAAYQAMDIISVVYADRVAGDLSYQMILDSQQSYLQIENKEVIRHLRRYQNLYLTKTPQELVDEDGQVNDQFLAGLLLAWQKHNAPRKEKMDLIRQIHLVLTMDRQDGQTTAGRLKYFGVTDPNVLQLNLGMNGLLHKSREQDVERHVKYASLGALAEWASVAALLAKDPSPQAHAFAIGIFMATMAGSVAWSHQYVDLFQFKFRDRTFTVQEEELAASFAAYRIHFANRSIDDLITDDGQIIDPFAEAILSVFNESGQRWTDQRNRRFLEQLLIVLQADTSDTVDDLAARGIVDTKFMQMFEAWQGIQRNRAMRGEES